MKGLVIVAAVLTALLCVPHPVSAATIPVTTTEDEINNGNSACSLREAIEAANTDSAVDSCPAGDGVDTIILPAGTYNLTIPGDTGFDNHLGALTIKSSLVISGAGRSTTFIIAAPGLNDAVIHSGVGADNTLIEGVTLQGGERSGLWNGSNSNLTLRSSAIISSTGILGGGIHNQGSLTVDDSIIDGNLHTGDSSEIGAGGINTWGTLTVTHSIITDNHSTSGSGGLKIYQGNVQVLSSTVSNNSGLWGGGLHVQSNTPSLIAHSVISANQAISGAGGVMASSVGVTILDTTVISNSAPLAGGIGNISNLQVESSRIYSNSAENGGGIGNAANLEVNNSHIAYNTAADIGGGIGNDGGTHFAFYLVGSAIVTNSTIEQNYAARGGGIGNAGTFTLTGSLIGENEASERGGGISLGNGSMNISDTTIADNSAPLGGGFFLTYEDQYGTVFTTLQLQTTELLDNEGGNCSVSGGNTTSLGNNTSSDSSCVDTLNGSGDQNETGDDGGDDGGGNDADKQIYLPQITP